ncbi:hypothetical protein [Sinorhizobium meliloti]|uniref:hypothetical protein n=1 Tax=Rhizobium meliloti TaxID=382 RepID=UPI000FD6D9EF|nr:hypothetical protein [Sinorhizobium meliloti]RVE81439.1 hypothetical protein CN238_29765 [Sinorhizobium meliloti]RVH23391.1 hypothetical protein CN214_27790 [Sinorhizobium meliloti]
MNEDVRLYIVTDDPARACLAVIGCHLTELPPIFRIVTGPEQIAAIPNGARCIGHWFSWKVRRPSRAQMAWEELRARAGDRRPIGLDDKFFQLVDEWNAKRRKAESERLASIVAEYVTDNSQGGAPAENSQKQRWF